MCSVVTQVWNHFTVKVGTKFYSQKHHLMCSGRPVFHTLTQHQWDTSPKRKSCVSGGHLQFSREDRNGWQIMCPGSFNGSPVNVAIVAFPEAEAEWIEVKLASAVIAQELPLLFIFSQREARVGILHQNLSCSSPPERRQDWSWEQQHTSAPSTVITLRFYSKANKIHLFPFLTQFNV